VTVTLILVSLAAGGGQADEEARPPAAAVIGDGSGPRPEVAGRHRRLMQEAREALSAGEPARAAALFEDASHLDDETPDAEIGMVQAYLEGGEYRKALAFATLTAGEHPDSREAEALLAWIEFLGGRKDQALRRLAIASSRVPDDPALLEVRSRIRAVAAGTQYPMPARRSLALDPRAPRGPGASRPLRGLASGVVVASGTRVLTSASAVTGASGGLWVQNALGRQRPAVVERVDRRAGVAVLKLAEPLEPASSFEAGAAARPFPGSPCYLVEYPAAGMDRPSWPVLSVGFLGSAGAGDGMFELSMDLPPGPRGGAVLDLGGRLVGLAIPAAAGRPGARIGPPERLVTGPVLEPLLPASGGRRGQVAGGAPPRLPLGEIYERALLAVVAVLRAP
jgi:hypothetical protein